jgi:hypothetical protein
MAGKKNTVGISETNEREAFIVQPAKIINTFTAVTPDKQSTKTTLECQTSHSCSAILQHTHSRRESNTNTDKDVSAPLYFISETSQSNSIRKYELELINPVSLKRGMTSFERDSCTELEIRNIHGEIISPLLLGGISDEDIWQLFDTYFP